MANQANKPKKVKEFDTVNYFRTIKERIANETTGMTYGELKQYLSQRELKTSKKAAV